MAEVAKTLSPNMRYFIAILSFVAIYSLLEIFGQKKCLFGSKTVFLGQEVHYYMVNIAYFTESFCKFAITRKNDAFDAKIVNTRWTKILVAIFAPDERLPSSATLS